MQRRTWGSGAAGASGFAPARAGVHAGVSGARAAGARGGPVRPRVRPCACKCGSRAQARATFLGLKHYPIFLDLKDRPVLVAGAGKVALRKVRGLLEAGARVTVVAPEWAPEFESLPVRLLRRRFRARDVAGQILVFAATDDRMVNRRIGMAARSRGVFANIADRAAECDFVVPARVERGGVQVAIATGGRNPRMAAELRRKLEGLW